MRADIDANAVKRDNAPPRGQERIGVSPCLKSALERAFVASRQLGHSYVRAEHLLIGLAEVPGSFAGQLLARLGVQSQPLRRQTLLAAGNKEKASAPPPPSRTPNLDRHSRDLTALAREGSLDPVIGRSGEIETMVEVLARRRKHVPIIGPLNLELSLNEDTIRGISIGDHAYLNADTRLACRNSRISIGDDVQIGPRVSFETATHGISFEPELGRGLGHRAIGREQGVDRRRGNDPAGRDHSRGGSGGGRGRGDEERAALYARRRCAGTEDPGHWANGGLAACARAALTSLCHVWTLRFFPQTCFLSIRGRPAMSRTGRADCGGLRVSGEKRCSTHTNSRC